MFENDVINSKMRHLREYLEDLAEYRSITVSEYKNRNLPEAMPPGGFGTGPGGERLLPVATEDVEHENKHVDKIQIQ